jgi:hypothetical protein
MSTTGTPSISDATICGQSGPGSGISANRSGTTPASTAASKPRSGIPTAAAYAPSVIAAPAKASSNDVAAGMATVTP